MRYNMWYTLIVRDKDGRVVYKARRRAHTLNKNFGLIATYLVFPKGDTAQSFTVVDSTGASVTLKVPDASVSPTSYAPGTSYGIQLAIGSGTTAFSRNDYKLASEIASFTASTYQVTDTGSSVQLVIQGSYTPTANITINEIGIYAYFKDSTGAMKKILLARDVLSSAVSVSAGQTVTVKYTITEPF